MEQVLDRLLDSIKAGLDMRPPEEFYCLKSRFLKQFKVFIHCNWEKLGVETRRMFLGHYTGPAVFNLKPFPAFDA